MNVTFRKSFIKDLRRANEQGLRNRLQAVIERIEHAERLGDIPSLGKLQGFDSYYRIRLGDYRLGLEGDEVTLVRFLNRKEMYRYFP